VLLLRSAVRSTSATAMCGDTCCYSDQLYDPLLQLCAETRAATPISCTIHFCNCYVRRHVLLLRSAVRSTSATAMCGDTCCCSDQLYDPLLQLLCAETRAAAPIRYRSHGQQLVARSARWTPSLAEQLVDALCLLQQIVKRLDCLLRTNCSLHVALTSGPLCTSPQHAYSSVTTIRVTLQHNTTFGNFNYKTCCITTHEYIHSLPYALLAFLKKWA
jgi:hypothetical protein